MPRKAKPAINPIIDHLIAELDLKNDAALSRALAVAPPAISKIRNCQINVSSDVLLRMHDVTGLPVDHLRLIAGIEKPIYGAHP